jgi:ElaB/YqjD/DUF883 family membrane-anchored ribosome-binding protein
MADNMTTGTTGQTSSGEGNGGFGAATATSLAQTAQDYAGKVSDAAVQAREYVTEKVGAVGDKIKDIDFQEITANCKDYARKNPGQAILISAGVGLLLGILVRGRR